MSESVEGETHAESCDFTGLPVIIGLAALFILSALSHWL